MLSVALGASDSSGVADVGSLGDCGWEGLVDGALVLGFTLADVVELVEVLGVVVEEVLPTDVVGAVESIAGDEPVEQAVNR